MNTIQELKILNEARAIFEKYRIDQSLYPQLGQGEYYVTNAHQVYDIIQEVVELFGKNKKWNLGKFPGEDGTQGQISRQ